MSTGTRAQAQETSEVPVLMVKFFQFIDCYLIVFDSRYCLLSGKDK